MQQNDNTDKSVISQRYERKCIYPSLISKSRTVEIVLCHSSASTAALRFNYKNDEDFQWNIIAFGLSYLQTS